ncbi:hypothetical protein OC845_000700 [Tilletia horrida]|nr:hypothetical protein OC845_000700 [Tilletia horrida]
MEEEEDQRELEFEEVDVDFDLEDDLDGGSDLADAYAAAYDEVENATDDAEEDNQHSQAGPSSAQKGKEKAKVPVYYDGKGQHRGVVVSVETVKKPSKDEAAKKRRPVNMLTPQDRRNRLAAHMLHVICLIVWARHRNNLLNDSALQDYLAEMVPTALITKLRSIHPKKISEQRERVRLFETFMAELLAWWATRFRLDLNMVNDAAIRQPISATELLVPVKARALPPGKVIDGWIVESPQEREERHRKEGKGKAVSKEGAAKGKERPMEIAIFPPGQEAARNTTLPTYLRLLPPPEPIFTAEHLIKAASIRLGSRETSAQLFCALCRAIGVPARLVVSLQVPPYSVGASKLASIATEAARTSRKKPSASLSASGPSTTSSSSNAFKYKLRKQSKAKAQPVTQVADDDAPFASAAEPINLETPPTVWVEVFSKPYQRWLTVDPIRGDLQATGNRYMEPAPHDKNNKLVYVIAVEEDNYCRDVTARYTRSLRSRVARLRPPAAMTGGRDWWDRVANAIHRPQRLDRDALEDAEMDQALQREPMPKSLAAFKGHPVYVLESQLKRNEALFPRNRVGTFENQDVFLRQDVVEVHSIRQWYVNYGRVLRRGADGSESTDEPLKWGKTRGYTIANKRAEEQARAEGREPQREGLFAEFQTEVYVAPPVGDDGTIPTNAFGNVDMYVHSMLPPGGAYIPFAGAAKVAKQLHIPYADAVTGFEFRRGRSNPKVEGVVVAQFNAQTLLDAFWESQRVNAEKERRKVRERAIRNWRRAYKSVLISLRIKKQYGPGSSAAADAAFNKAMGRDADKKNGKKGKGKEVRQLRQLDDEDDGTEDEEPSFLSSVENSTVQSDDDVAPGGFLPSGEAARGGFLLSDDEPAPGGFFMEAEETQGGFVRDDDEVSSARSDQYAEPPSERSTSSAPSGPANTTKRKIVSLYELGSAASSSSRRTDETPVTRTDESSATRRPSKRQKNNPRTNGKRPQPQLQPSSTPLRRSSRNSARVSSERQRDLERAQLEALRDVLDEDELAREERELADADSDSDID